MKEGLEPLCPHCKAKMVIAEVGETRIFWKCTCPASRTTRYITGKEYTGEETWTK